MSYAPGSVPSDLPGLQVFLQEELARIASMLNGDIGYWTPIIAGTSTAGANTYAMQNGRYFAFGNKVFLDFRVALSAKDAAMAGNVLITGLPIPNHVPFTGVRSAIANINASNVNLSANSVGIYAAVASSGVIELTETIDNSAAISLPVSALGNSSELFGSITYERK